MSLVAGKETFELNETDFVDAGAAAEHWRDWPASTISHHGRPCCDVAREWFLATDYSQLNAGSRLTGPRWVRHKYKWGPSRWPIHWCEAVREETLDCGALAALAHEVFAARGLVSLRAQFIQQFTEDATRQWCERWGCADVPVRWIRDDVIYHEGCAVVLGDRELKVWDASAGWWVSPKQFGGYGGLVAIRIFEPPAAHGTAYRLGAHAIAPNVLLKLE